MGICIRHGFVIRRKCCFLDAENLIRLGSAVVDEGVTVTFSQPTLLRDDVEETLNKTVIVSGFKTVPKESLLRLYFENAGKSGGGTIQELKILQEKKQVIITFHDETGTVLVYVLPVITLNCVAYF